MKTDLHDNGGHCIIITAIPCKDPHDLKLLAVKASWYKKYSVPKGNVYYRHIADEENIPMDYGPGRLLAMCI